jgi:tripartite ATP-independent transporter DctM subunit
MEPVAIAIILFGSLLLFIALGLPIAFTMGGLATLFTLWFWGLKGTYMIVTTAFGELTSFILIAIPLFIYMGVILEQTGMADDLYEAVYRWLGGVKGGLAIGTVMICAIFAAMVGTSSTATITMGLIALPSMLKRGYNKIMITGCISAGGALGILIPPSVIMILYCSITEVSVGKMFFAGMFPGILLALIYMAYIYIRCTINPSLGPPIPKAQRFTFRNKLVSLKGVIFPLVLILLVLGTIYTGICTPTESAGIGALGSLIVCAINGKLTWSNLKESGFRTVRINSLVMWIMVGAVSFSHCFIVSGAGDSVTNAVVGLQLNRWVILWVMQIIFMILGCFIDPAGIMMICTPAFLPIIRALGFDPLWFGILFIINMEMAYITPPFGFNLFYMRSIVPPEISMFDLYRSVIPFVFCQLLCLIIVMIFPEIALWLPSKMITK